MEPWNRVSQSGVAGEEAGYAGRLDMAKEIR